ncbi:hypothetical protein ACF09C_33295 [Streptomyces sp. NPDC014870]|uniref:hypothetical protein n=1 Tax=Streptomyces sp. NPDC014870 TaxID=3364925 RepID=UPI0036F86128
MRTALRTAVATALLAGVAVTPALTAGTAFAADAKPVAGAGTAADAPGTLVRTETLRDGTIAKIYKVGAAHHRADLFFDGKPVGVLDANTRPDAGNDNGTFFVLFEDGRTLAWERNYVPGAQPGVYKLADGTVLQLAKKDGRYGLQLIENGKGRGFTYLNGFRQVWTYGKAVVVLEQDGGFAAYIPGSTVQAAPALVSTENPGGGQGPETPVGEKIGTRKLADGTVGDLWRHAKGHYTLELKTAAGKPRGSVTAGGPGGKAEKGAQFGEMWVTLDNKGQVGSWMNRNLGTDYADSTKGCTVTRDSGSAFDELSLQLVNSPSGAFARILHDDAGKVLATLTLTKSTALADGVWLSTLPGAKKPIVQMRTSEPEELFTLDFPDLPKGCAAGTPETKPTTPAPGTSAGTSGQTTVVPQGGVAAGAELGSVESANDAALMASGLGAAAVVAAGLGFTVLRRRAAARG